MDTTTTSTLPTDIVLLQQMLLEQQTQNQRLLEQVTQLTFTIGLAPATLPKGTVLKLSAQCYF